MPPGQMIDQALLRLVINQLLETKRTLKLLTDMLIHDLTPEQYAVVVEEPGLLRVLAQMDKDIEHLLKVMRQLPPAPCYRYPKEVDLRHPHVPIIPQQPPGEWQARINDHWGIGHNPDPFKRDREALYGEVDEKP